MKLLPVVVALAACQGAPSKAPPAPGSAAPIAPPVVRPDQVCLDAIAAVHNAACGGSAARDLKAVESSLEATVAAMAKAGSVTTEQYDVVCGSILLALERDTAKLGCTLPIDPALRTSLTEKLDRYYAHRTPVTKTGDPAGDEVIRKVAALRDAACACQDEDCLAKLEIPKMPPPGPGPVNDLLNGLLDDMARCSQRIGLRK